MKKILVFLFLAQSINGLSQRIISDNYHLSTRLVDTAAAIRADIAGKLNSNGNGSELTGLTKAQVGLSNVDNTSDADKPVSTATQTALDLKSNITDAALITPTVSYTASPSAPSADKVRLYDYKVGGKDMLGFIASDGVDYAVQTMIARNGVKFWSAAGNSTTITAVGAAALTATGTATAVNVATTNRYTQMRGLEYLVTVAATNAVAGFRDAVAQYWLGNTSGSGGFHFVCRFGPATGVATATHRLFVGLTSGTGAPTDVEPSSLTNMFGVGYDAADANIQFFNNDGSGTATKTSLGIAVPTADRTSVYELAMYAAPNSTTIYYTFKDLASGGSTVSGSVNTDIPAVNTLLAARGWMSVGGSSSVIGIALKSLYLESDY